MAQDIDKNETTGEQDAGKPWIAPQVVKLSVADAENQSNPGDDGSGVFTSS